MKKTIILIAAFCAFSVSASASDKIKGDFAHLQVIENALSALDGTVKLDKDNAQVRIAYDFTGKTRLAIAFDLGRVHEAIQTYREAVQSYMKGSNLSDMSKATPEQVAKVNEICAAPTEVQVRKIDEAELRADANAFPPSVLTALDPLINH